MPRWFVLTVAVAALAVSVVEYFKPQLWLIGGLGGGAVVLLVVLLAAGGDFAISLAERRARKLDEFTTLNLTGSSPSSPVTDSVGSDTI